jgi:hypothetical protein
MRRFLAKVENGISKLISVQFKLPIHHFINSSNYACRKWFEAYEVELGKKNNTSSKSLKEHLW